MRNEEEKWKTSAYENGGREAAVRWLLWVIRAYGTRITTKNEFVRPVRLPRVT